MAVGLWQWANVDYFYFFHSSHFCKMGRQAAKPKTVMITETSGFKEEDRLWSIINIHLSCAINTVLSLCAVIFVLCLLAFIIHHIVRRYCKKRLAAKERQHWIQLLPFHLSTSRCPYCAFGFHCKFRGMRSLK
jgi:hypothetical protein